MHSMDFFDGLQKKMWYERKSHKSETAFGSWVSMVPITCKIYKQTKIGKSRINRMMKSNSNKKKTSTDHKINYI